MKKITLRNTGLNRSGRPSGDLFSSKVNTMSVFVLNKTDFDKIYSYLMTHRELIDSNEYFGYLSRMFSTNPEKIDDLMTHAVGTFVDRMYMANQMAYYYSYSHHYPDNEPFPIDRLCESDLHGISYVTTKQVVDIITTLDYNLFSNAGHAFLGRKDHDQLDLLISALKSKLIHDQKHGIVDTPPKYAITFPAEA